MQRATGPSPAHLMASARRRFPAPVVLNTRDRSRLPFVLQDLQIRSDRRVPPGRQNHVAATKLGSNDEVSPGTGITISVAGEQAQRLTWQAPSGGLHGKHPQDRVEVPDAARVDVARGRAIENRSRAHPAARSAVVARRGVRFLYIPLLAGVGVPRVVRGYLPPHITIYHRRPSAG